MLLLKLFFAFIQVGMFSVGGGYAAIPLIQEQIVNIYGLMTLEEFSDLITVAEMTPGPISINSATFVGMRIAGIPGVLLCSIGCIIPSFCICLILAHFYYKYRSVGGVQVVLGAMRPAVVSLIASAGASILMLGLFQAELREVVVGELRVVELGIFVVALFLLRKYKVSAIAIILGSGVVAQEESLRRRRGRERPPVVGGLHHQACDACRRLDEVLPARGVERPGEPAQPLLDAHLYDLPAAAQRRLRRHRECEGRGGKGSGGGRERLIACEEWRPGLSTSLRPSPSRW